MNLVIATLLGTAVAVWVAPWSSMRLASLNLSRADEWHTAVLDVLRKRMRRSVQRQLDARAVIDSLAAFEMELRSGQSPSSALVLAASAPPIWPAALSAVGMQGDVAQALVVDAQRHPDLGQLAACWLVASNSGSGMSAAVERMIHGLRENEELRNTLQGELAGPRATAAVLRWLPLIGLLMGIAMGADPIGWLLGSPLGIVCLVLGVTLSILGSLWSRRMVRAVEELL
ncbi:MAG: hypothetical protein PHN51_07545 [Candidatus Nanopelagicales bacterium]|nr:hypothetical protein [Candidatus Nanopelagicales bacterium]